MRGDVRGAAGARLRATIAAELQRPVLSEAQRVVEHALSLHGSKAGTILFYGSCLRAASPEGIMDVYLLPERYRAFHGSVAAAALNRLIPPNVYFWSIRDSGTTLRAKVASVSRRQFAAGCSHRALSPSIWARFCQPVALLHAPDERSAEATAAAIATAVTTAARWAALLGPRTGTPRDYWVGLFRASYGTELRPEREDRPVLVYEANAERYDRILPQAWEAAGISFGREPDGSLRPRVSEMARRRARLAWSARRAFGKILSLIRLLKGAFTFAGAVDYLLWKIERHWGQPVEVAPWERRHPFIGAPLVFVRLARQGAFR